MKRRNIPGFTVVELAVVIAVIAVLASIIIVAYNKVQGQSRDTKRENDSIILGAALEKYFDKNGIYPTGCGWSSCSGSAGNYTMPNTDVLSVSTTQSSLATMLGDTTKQVLDPKITPGPSATPFIGTSYRIVSSTAPGYVYRGGNVIDPAAAVDPEIWMMVLQNEPGTSPSKSCEITTTLVRTRPAPNDTMAYFLAYYSESTDTWQIKLGNKGEKPIFKSWSTPNYCVVTS